MKKGKRSRPTEQLRREKFTDAVEDYLKVIYKIAARREFATVNDIAVRMKISAPSVTNMVKKMGALDLVSHVRYGHITLTEKGMAVALEVIRHHRLWELYLVRRLGIPLDQVDVEAERLEHVLSDELEEQFARILGDPVRDPHGDAIPGKDGSLGARPQDRKISDLRVGEMSIISHVIDSNPVLLRTIMKMGCLPGVKIRLRKLSAGSRMVSIQVGSRKMSLSSESADLIRVR